jgi:LacI family gluconate utilization system Gnt-I transcriptional repressor
MIGAGGLLYCLDRGFDIPDSLGLAGFNGVNLLRGLPKHLATMDACRHEIGRKSAEIIAARTIEGAQGGGEVVVLEPAITYGDTLRPPLDGPLPFAEIDA